MNKKMIFLLCAGLLSSQLAVGMEKFEDRMRYLGDEFWGGGYTVGDYELVLKDTEPAKKTYEELSLPDDFYSRETYEQIKFVATKIFNLSGSFGNCKIKITNVDISKMQNFCSEFTIFFKLRGFKGEIKSGVVTKEKKSVWVNVTRIYQFNCIVSSCFISRD